MESTCCHAGGSAIPDKAEHKQLVARLDTFGGAAYVNVTEISSKHTPAVPFSRLNSSRQERWMTERLSRLNFRDLGGLLATGGRHLRFGVLYRSEGPARFEAGHRKELAQLDFKLICDLRTDFEREAAPNDWTPSLPL